MAGPQAPPKFDPNAPMSDMPAVAPSLQTAPSTPTQPLQFDPNAPMSDVPSTPGQIINDVGQTVIVPQEGESFADTLKRAVAFRKSLTPEQQQASINAETATIPKKTAQTLGAAAGIGIAGPAALAAPGEIGPAVGTAAARATPYVLKVGQWAKENPVAAYAALEALKMIIPGFRKATQVIKGIPTPPQ